jgi:hypothetical protein
MGICSICCKSYGGLRLRLIFVQLFISAESRKAPAGESVCWDNENPDVRSLKSHLECKPFLSLIVTEDISSSNDGAGLSKCERGCFSSGRILADHICRLFYLYWLLRSLIVQRYELSPGADLASCSQVIEEQVQTQSSVEAIRFIAWQLRSASASEQVDDLREVAVDISSSKR